LNSCGLEGGNLPEILAHPSNAANHFMGAMPHMREKGLFP